MARFELKRSLRPASCCRVDVMNGGAGDRRNGLWVIDFTAKGAPSRAAANPTTEPEEVSAPVSSKSRPDANDTPSTATSDAVNEVGIPSLAGELVVKVPSRPHQSAERNFIRARSRSTTMRVATLWTRPADSRGMIFFHRTGDTS